MHRSIERKSICNNIDRNTFMQNLIRFSLLQIYGASTASYGKKVSSTYLRYACGTFLLYFLYLHRLFAKVHFRSGTNAAGTKRQRRFATWQNSCFPIDTDVYRKTTFLCRKMCLFHPLPVHQGGWILLPNEL